MRSTLADRLKTETRALHTAAERSPLMGELLRGRLERASYCALLRNLHALYAALEPALERHALHPIIRPFLWPALWRARPIEQDLLVLHGDRWSAELALLPAAARYVDRLREIETAQPERLLGHAYVRYLGDLSGGQMLRRIVAKSMPVAGRSVTAFYDFGDATQTAELVRAFRHGLDSVAPDEEQTNAIVAEAKLAFEWHERLFDELLAIRPLPANARAPHSKERHS